MTAPATPGSAIAEGRPVKIVMSRAEVFESSGPAPAALAPQELAHGHGLDLGRARANYVDCGKLATKDAALQGGAGETDSVGVCESLHVLRWRRDDG